MGEDAALDARAQQMLERRYPSGFYHPALACGFASYDLIEFTLLRAYIEAHRLQEAKRLLDIRRTGASRVPVMGIAAVH